MSLRVLHFDVFSETPGKGNPAGVALLDHPIEEQAMQWIAGETAVNDTAFVSPSSVADFRIRYFSPRREVDLCGHATIAASLALHTQGGLARKPLPCGFSIETRAGILPIEIGSSPSGRAMVFMQQAPAAFKEFGGNRALLLQALGVSFADLHPLLPMMYGSTGRWTLLVPLLGLDAMGRMQVRPEQFAAALTDMPEASVHPFCLETSSAEVHLHARHFSSPSSGTVEDPVTGTASGVLGAYYRAFVESAWNGAAPLVVEQGLEIGREGRVSVWVTKTSDQYHVRIAGTACFVQERALMLRAGLIDRTAQ